MDRKDIYDREAALRRYGSEDTLKKKWSQNLSLCDTYVQTLHQIINAGNAQHRTAKLGAIRDISALPFHLQARTVIQHKPGGKAHSV